VIGVYEPLVVRVGGATRESALAADPQLSTTPKAALFRRDCHAPRDARNAVRELRLVGARLRQVPLTAGRVAPGPRLNVSEPILELAVGRAGQGRARLLEPR
jgi:hypothetical protein